MRTTFKVLIFAAALSLTAIGSQLAFADAGDTSIKGQDRGNLAPGSSDIDVNNVSGVESNGSAPIAQGLLGCDGCKAGVNEAGGVGPTEGKSGTINGGD